LPFYLVVCIGAGIVLTRLIETPFLAKRDEKWPNRSKAAPVPVPLEKAAQRKRAAV
jgi:hypothetical protein